MVHCFLFIFLHQFWCLWTKYDIRNLWLFGVTYFSEKKSVFWQHILSNFVAIFWRFTAQYVLWNWKVKTPSFLAFCGTNLGVKAFMKLTPVRCSSVLRIFHIKKGKIYSLIDFVFTSDHHILKSIQGHTCPIGCKFVISIYP